MTEFVKMTEEKFNKRYYNKAFDEFFVKISNILNVSDSIDNRKKIYNMWSNGFSINKIIQNYNDKS